MLKLLAVCLRFFFVLRWPRPWRPQFSTLTTWPNWWPPGIDTKIPRWNTFFPVQKRVFTWDQPLVSKRAWYDRFIGFLSCFCSCFANVVPVSCFIMFCHFLGTTWLDPPFPDGVRPEVLSDDGAGTPSIDGVVAGGIKPSGGEHHFVGGKNGFHPKFEFWEPISQTTDHP